MDIGIVFFSKTGNTEKIAKAIGSEMKVRPLKVETCRKTSFDFVFIGSPTHGMKPAAEIMEFMDNVQAKYAAVFETHSGLGAVDWMEKKLKERGITVLGRFSCRGGVRHRSVHPEQGQAGAAGPRGCPAFREVDEEQAQESPCRYPRDSEQVILEGNRTTEDGLSLLFLARSLLSGSLDRDGSGPLLRERHVFALVAVFRRYP